MKKKNVELTEEELDFIKEMMDIGAGNAATALEQMLGFPTYVKIPLARQYKKTEIDTMYDIVGDSTQMVTATLMNLVGHVKGRIIFVVPTKELVNLVNFVEKATPGGCTTGNTLNFSIVAELGNILAGNYLNSIHDFCLLTIYHSVPVIKSSPFRILISEQFPKDDTTNARIMLFYNEFFVGSDMITTYLLLVPDSDSMDRIVQSLRQAKDKLSLP